MTEEDIGKVIDNLTNNKKLDYKQLNTIGDIKHNSRIFLRDLSICGIDNEHTKKAARFIHEAAIEAAKGIIRKNDNHS